MRRALLPLALSLTLLGPALAAPPLSGAQEARALAIEKNLRCPLCDTGESIADSRSTISVKMRDSVREQIAAGRTDTDIYVYFAQRYGNFVLLDPPKKGRNLLLWGAPLAALAVGGGALWAFLRRGRAAPSTPDPATEDGAFDPFLAQVQRDTRGRGEG
ncbi:cytochrome c-type biogenesis protein CcmH [Deinococcus taeanensis]|uniref:cytochrome c-type biogenesis protein n=1 Tax=Deinococcus taeanensis TaxID=2737050 RepID=UPI001CDB848F|nr:cytochrome c-type biogenesis protein [Deinococcus taeanensis]UBV43443.1 cytochrome c-type biogenesis protein CcmH [Deinococcus taeanensis]